MDDLPMLIESLLQRTSKDRGRKVTLTPDALALMQRYSWPGNIRELRNALERASLFTEDAVIRPEHLGDTVDGPMLKPTNSITELPSSTRDRARILSDSEILTVSATYPGNRKSLAKHLGLSERTLFRRLKKLQT
jgi:transcriptional regulator with PAS, ATPase and Fis domain